MRKSGGQGKPPLFHAGKEAISELLITQTDFDNSRARVVDVYSGGGVTAKLNIA